MYKSETEKAKELIKDYLVGKVIDIGAGGYKVLDTAISVDGRNVDNTDIILGDPNMIYHLSKIDVLSDADCVFSSHTLEHLQDDYAAIFDWAKIIKKDGYLILYLPDGTKYSNYDNPEHCRDYTYTQFMLFFNRCFCGAGKTYDGTSYSPVFKLIESGEDFRKDCYSFYVVAQKL